MQQTSSATKSTTDSQHKEYKSIGSIINITVMSENVIIELENKAITLQIINILYV